MKKLLFALAVAGAFAPSLSQAQVKIDMTKITCGQVLDMSPDLQSDYAAWMSGWFAQKSGRTFIDLGLFHKNYDSVDELVRLEQVRIRDGRPATRV